MKAPTQHATHAVVTLLIVAGSLAAYDRWVLRPALRIGVVDVGEVYRQKEAEFTTILTRAGNDAERERAMSMARAFAKRLPHALDELPADCSCLVLIKGSVAAPALRTFDLTAHLRRKVDTP
jgi:hypothetical protein